MKVATRVTSVWNARTSRSHIRRKCSARSAGTLGGLTASVGRLDRRQRLGAGDPQLQLADAGEVLVELLPVGAARAGCSRPRASSSTESSMLDRSRFRLRRSGSLGRSAKSRSKTSRGLTSVGSGEVGERQEIVCS